LPEHQPTSGVPRQRECARVVEARQLLVEETRRQAALHGLNAVFDVVIGQQRSG
jgi:hypothetical protein